MRFTLPILYGCLALISGCGSAPEPIAPVSEMEPIRITRHGLAAEFMPAIDRLTYFGRDGGSNLLHLSALGRDVPAEGSYTFWGGCYTWVSPQKGVEGSPIGWVDADRTTKMDWPPDPAMDIGPARRAGFAPGSFSVVGPDLRSGLREEKTFRIISDDTAELTYTLRNRGPTPTTAGTWTNIAASLGDFIAVKLPTGSATWGWDQSSVDSFRSIAGEPDARGWVLVELSKAKWDGGIKVYLTQSAVAPMQRPEIAVWRRGAKAWLHRSLEPMSATDLRRLREMGEGPVAVYIQPNGGKDPIIEAELYAPIAEVAPGAILQSTETWRIIPSDKPDTSRLP